MYVHFFKLQALFLTSFKDDADIFINLVMAKSSFRKKVHLFDFDPFWSSIIIYQ